MKIHNVGVRMISWMMLAALLSQGCTSFHTYEAGNEAEFIEEVNEKGAEKKARISFSDGYTSSAMRLHIRPDSSFWYEGRDLQPVHHPTPEINEVRFTDRPKGAGEGFLLGAVPIFVFAGILAIAESRNDQRCNDITASCFAFNPETLIGLGMGAAFINGLVFASLGYLVGHEDVYSFSSASSSTGILKQWGFKAGRTWAIQSWEGDVPSSWYNTSNVSWASGIHLGCYAEWFDYYNFSITTGLNLEEKGFDYYVSERKAEIHPRYYYVSLPVAARYSIRRGFFRPYLLAGPRVDFFVASSDDIWGVASSYNNYVFGLSLGGGIEFWSDSKRSIFVECIYNYDIGYACEAEQPYPGASVKIKNDSYNLSLGLGFN